MLTNKTALAWWIKILSQLLVCLNAHSVGPVDPKGSLGTPVKAPDTVRKVAGNSHCPNSHHGSTSYTVENTKAHCSWEVIILWNLQCDVPWGGWVTLYPWGRGTYSDSTGIPLCLWNLQLLKYTIPGMEHATLEEGTMWGPWSGITRPQSIFSSWQCCLLWLTVCCVEPAQVPKAANHPRLKARQACSVFCGTFIGLCFLHWSEGQYSMQRRLY